MAEPMNAAEVALLNDRNGMFGGDGAFFWVFALWYARSAIECKDNDPASAEMFYRIANEEIGHANMLHTRVVAIIEEYKKTNGEPPSDMMKLYDYLHKKHIGNLATVKGILGLYK